jgi:hypothetical protein
MDVLEARNPPGPDPEIRIIKQSHESLPVRRLQRPRGIVLPLVRRFYKRVFTIAERCSLGNGSGTPNLWASGEKYTIRRDSRPASKPGSSPVRRIRSEEGVSRSVR